MDQSICLSFIVPAYNAAPYLRKCLDSIMAQQNEHTHSFEIIVVNDGSVDATPHICQQFADEHAGSLPITIIHQENKGLSEARNAGIAQAKGEYVWCVDADDWLLPNALDKVFGKITACHPDVIHFKRVIGDGNKIVKTFPDYKCPDLLAGKYFLNRYYITPCAQFYVMRKEFLMCHSLKFYPGIFFEDTEFTPRMLFFAKKMVVIDESLYYIYLSPNSITRGVNFKKPYDHITVSISLRRFTESPMIDSCTRRTLHTIVSTCINNSMFEAQSMPEELKSSFNNHLQSNRAIFTSFFHSNRLKHRVQGLFFFLFHNRIGAYRLMTLSKKTT